MDSHINEFVRLKHTPSAQVKRWQVLPVTAPNREIPLQERSTNIQEKKPEGARLVMKYKKTPKSQGRSSPPRGVTPSRSRTPGAQRHKTPKKTPGKPAYTPSNSCRFIPNRATMEYSSFLMRKDEEKTESSVGGGSIESPTREEYKQRLLAAVSRSSHAPRQKSVLSFKTTTPTVSGSSFLEYSESMPGLGDSVCNSRKKKSGHKFQGRPDRILDAPSLMDDYYLNTLDWGKNNYVAIGLGSGVYLWNAATESVQLLMEMTDEDQYVSSVAWAKNGKYLAIGGSNAIIQLWDPENQKKIREMKGHSERISVLAWKRHTVASASKDGLILYNDVRQPKPVVGRSSYHQLEVCGLEWSPDGTRLASGANDNMVCVWNESDSSQPAQVLRGHQAAVKAVAWCPWQPNLLVTGGGTKDKTIRFWNAYSGQCTETIDAGSQVSALAWNKDHRQLISAHGSPRNSMVVWQYPHMTKLAELSGHTERILHMALSPRRSRVASAAGDETLRIWTCFERLKHDISQRSYTEDLSTLLQSFS